MTAAHASPVTTIPDELFEELRYVEVYTRRKIENLMVGAYTSSLKGVGFDFWEHRPYEPGEDIRRIDWNATARLGQIVLKLDHAERELNAIIAVDLSRSMEFTSRRLTKRELQLRVAGCLAFSAAADHMQVGMVAFTDRLEAWFPPRQGRLQAWRILDHLWRTEPTGRGTDLKIPFQVLAQRLRKTTLVFVVSDFSASEFVHTGEFHQLAHGHDVVPIIVQDPLEESLMTASGQVRLRDLESGRERVISLSRRNRRAYAEEMARRREELLREFDHKGIDYVYLRSGEPYVDALVRLFLARRRHQR